MDYVLVGQKVIRMTLSGKKGTVQHLHTKRGLPLAMAKKVGYLHSFSLDLMSIYIWLTKLITKFRYARLLLVLRLSPVGRVALV